MKIAILSCSPKAYSTRKKHRPFVQDLDTHINDVVASDDGDKNI